MNSDANFCNLRTWIVPQRFLQTFKINTIKRLRKHIIPFMGTSYQCIMKTNLSFLLHLQTMQKIASLI